MVVAALLQILMYRRQTLSTWPMTSKPAAISPVVRSLRPVYPYSVIPGGVYSREELIRARATDRLVHDHYADFNFAAAHLVTTAEDRFAYVSYRLGGRLLWTAHKLRIPKGETLLTDGVNFCRTRCGNRLSAVPHRETIAMEPSERLLNLPNFTPLLWARNLIELGNSPTVEDGTPVVPFNESRLKPVFPSGAQVISDREFLSSGPRVSAFPTALISVPAPAIYPPAPHTKPIQIDQTPTGSQPSPPSAVPEPQTSALILVALAGVCGVIAIRRRQFLYLARHVLKKTVSKAGENSPRR
jgi:hypothetical protein